MWSLARAALSIPQIIGPFRPIVPTFLQGLTVDIGLEVAPNLPAQYVLHLYAAYID
jgi:hypothetical protein